MCTENSVDVVVSNEWTTIREELKALADEANNPSIDGAMHINGLIFHTYVDETYELAYEGFTLLFGTPDAKVFKFDMSRGIKSTIIATPTAVNPINSITTTWGEIKSR